MHKDCSPLIAGQRVFFGDKSGNLYALDLNSGRQVWRFRAGGKILASPAAARGVLVVSTTDGGVRCFGERKVQGAPDSRDAGGRPR